MFVAKESYPCVGYDIMADQLDTLRPQEGVLEALRYINVGKHGEYYRGAHVIFV